ncbi:hypothetical protein AWB79_02172 [Caballeronia hypogeia]|uniref:Uncharacterized protein n=1 Tax=Caballeronia hypogeia TaxID=1777140 RepID=A0A158ABQ5_9BURK|nr:hypothetical protein [Caballeronia hypogeia]SAK55292.1 hypothetical protein AWB79_02172 [Caballeronia hypogeia]
MNDAEVAATLLNRWETENRGQDAAGAVGLLREGGLVFSHYVGVSHDTSEEFAEGVEIECLTFGDGSRAFRLTPRGMVRVSISWAAVPAFLEPDQANREAEAQAR